MIDKAGKPAAPIATPNGALPPPDLEDDEGTDTNSESEDCYSIPTLAELGYPPIPTDKPTPWKGGESEGLRMMREYLGQKNKVLFNSNPQSTKMTQYAVLN